VVDHDDEEVEFSCAHDVLRALGLRFMDQEEVEDG
jgi:hypothetical protein